MSVGGLSGRRILVPESRELDLFAAMLERDGATVLRCPLVTVLDVEDEAPVAAWLGRLVDGRLDDLVLYTGEGVRRLLGIASRAGTHDAVVAALGRARKIVRGPKPTRALRELGLAPEVTAPEPTTAGLMRALQNLGVEGRRIGLQAYPLQPPDMVSFLAGRGAMVDTVLPYRYAADWEDGRVLEAIAAMAEGRVDIVAFTSTPQVRRLEEVAVRHGATAALRAGMRLTAVAAVGPVTAEALTKAGWRDVVAPSSLFHLKPMMAAMSLIPGVPASSPDDASVRAPA